MADENAGKDGVVVVVVVVKVGVGKRLEEDVEAGNEGSDDEIPVLVEAAEDDKVKEKLLLVESGPGTFDAAAGIANVGAAALEVLALGVLVEVAVELGAEFAPAVLSLSWKAIPKGIVDVFGNEKDDERGMGGFPAVPVVWDVSASPLEARCSVEEGV